MPKIVEDALLIYTDGSLYSEGTTGVGCGAGHHRPAHLHLSALWRGDDRHRDLRPRRTNSRAAHVASCGMSTGIGCGNSTAALYRIALRPQSPGSASAPRSMRPRYGPWGCVPLARDVSRDDGAAVVGSRLTGPGVLSPSGATGPKRRLVETAPRSMSESPFNRSPNTSRSC